MTIIEDAKKYLPEKTSPFITKNRRLKRSAVLIEGLVKEIQRRDILLNPRLWTKEMHDAWHGNIPNVMAAFKALSQLEMEQWLRKPS